jgi:hypothetical protein
MQRRVFGPKRDEVARGSRKLVLFAKHKKNDGVKEDERSRAYSMNDAKRITYMILVGKPEGKRPLGRPRRRGGQH